MATTLVTGANRGIGFELATQLAARGDRVIAANRSGSAELEKLGVEVIARIDLADADCGKTLAKALGARSIDVLIHNAGILLPSGPLDLDCAGIQRQIDVNAVGPMRITEALLPNVPRGGKIAFISSRAGSIGDNVSGGLYGYRMSKAALNMAAVSLTRDVASRGISVCVLHPGFVKTEMTGMGGVLEPRDAARGLIARIDALTPETSGTFWHANGDVLPW